MSERRSTLSHRNSQSQTGVYCIENIFNGKFYIGSAAVSFRKRFSQHLRSLQCGKHRNSILQRAFNKYGKQAFQFSIIEYVTPENCIAREQFFMDLFSPQYNISPTAGSLLGVKHTGGACKKISLAVKEQWQDFRVREKRIAGIRGKYKDAEYKDRHDAIAKERGNCPVFRKKMVTVNKEKCKNPVFKEKMEVVYKKLREDPGFREKMTAINREKAKDLTWIEKLSAISKERWQDPVYKEKHSLAMKRVWAEKKALKQENITLASNKYSQN